MQVFGRNWHLHPITLVACSSIVSLAGGIAITRWWLHGSPSSVRPASATAELPQHDAESSGEIELPAEMWAASNLTVQAVSSQPLSRTIRLTGKVGLNEDRLAHIYPMVEGAVDSVHVQLGQQVRKDELLVVIHSREIGQSKLELYQARLQHQLAVAKDQRMQGIAENTTALISALRENIPINDIESMFRNRPMGDYRQQLLSAYAAYYKSQTDFQRLQSLGDNGAVAAKQFVSAEAARNADRATFQACLEQIEHDLKNALLQSSQAVSESHSRVAVAETSLKILGYSDDDSPNTGTEPTPKSKAAASDGLLVNPIQEGERISHYPIRAPFDGTILKKDVVLLEHVRPELQILTVADLATVWITADVYQEHMPMLRNLSTKTVSLRNEAWPDQEFTAEIFSSGDVMDESSRTIALRAVADNALGLLKPGMFVTVELPSVSREPVLQVPPSAIQEHEGQKFVFVHDGAGRFQRRDVSLGAVGEEGTEIKSGLTAGDEVVITGGFVLKSRMLADLMGGD